MKYILREKDTNNEEVITREEAVRLLKNNYRDAEYALDNACRLFGNRIAMTFTELEITN